MSRRPPGPYATIRPDRRIDAWPLLAGLVLGVLVVLRLRAEDDSLFTRDVQALLIVLMAGATVAAGVLGLLGSALRTLARRAGSTGRWPWLAPMWLAWWVGLAVFVASLVLTGWLLVTEGMLFP